MSAAAARWALSRSFSETGTEHFERRDVGQLGGSWLRSIHLKAPSIGKTWDPPGNDEVRHRDGVHYRGHNGFIWIHTANWYILGSISI